MRSVLLFLKRRTGLFLFAALLVFMATLNRDLPSRLSYAPTSEDQEKMYLLAGRAFAEHFVFFWTRAGAGLSRDIALRRLKFVRISRR
jgi:hypothetical protein